MFHSHAKFLLLVLLVVAGNTGFAQTGSTSNPTNGRENNPYSKYGIGELMNGNSTVLRGMGNATSAFENPYEMNTDNPASYSYMEQTIFELGLNANTRTITNGAGLTYTTGTSTISYFTLGFPVNKHAGFTIGFKPVSHVYYAMVDTLFSPISPIGQVVRSYNGEGGLNYAYMGGAWRYKGLSIGCNLGYMFGNIHNTTASVPIDPNVIYRANVAQYTTYNQLGGLAWKAGLMYEKKLDSNYTIRIGGTLALSQSLTQRMNAFQISSYNFGDTVVNDTISNSGEQHGKLKLPMSFCLGVMLSKNDKWSVGLDFASSQWSGYNSSLDSTMNTGISAQSYKLSLGGEYIPDANNLRNYFSRVTYRYGVYYGADYIKIQGTQIPCYGVTLGASLPVRRSFSRVHMAFDIGRLGTTTNSLLQETYVRFSFGVSLNNKWFVKRRYD